MRRQGRRFLTQCFLFLTGGIFVTIVAGLVYVFFEPEINAVRVLVLPLLAFVADVTWKFVTSTNVIGWIDRLATYTGVHTMITYGVMITGKLRVWQLLDAQRRFVLKLLKR